MTAHPNRHDLLLDLLEQALEAGGVTLHPRSKVRLRAALTDLADAEHVTVTRQRAPRTDHDEPPF